MMATAPTVNEPADVSASTNPQLTSSASDVDAATPAVNGVASHDELENKHISQVEETTNSAEASASGGSDTEASKARDGDKNHVRTGSTVKKPATFKALSVNKKFLASKAPTPAGTTKLSDTKPAGSNTPPPSGTGLLSSRPRLVAKTGSGTGNGGQRLSGVNGGKPAGPPDGSVVWNKNKATPQADTKKFTDEDLQKKYGIHMASRLDTGEVSGQNKWADIDDDDDDWAPEAITWTDGTKTALAHPDEAPPTAPEPAIAQFQQPPQPMPPAPTTTAPQQRQGLPSGRGLVLNKPAQDKASLAAKPSVQQSAAKSPWASLPTVERASPAGIESAPSASRGAMNQQWSQKGPAPQGGHMSQISADDFSRSSWRGESQGNRELFNSQSGRYEPVPERRGSLRPDQKHHAVLQRPSGGEHPAEPSSAFQTHRTSQEGHFGRRRGSSNVSGGSGSFYQRAGKGSDGHMPPPELSGGARRPSFAVSSEGPVSPALPSAGLNRGFQQPQQGYPPRPSPGSNFAAPHQAGPMEPVPPVPHAPAPQSQSDIEYQQKLMKESREAARKRRQEEEAAAESAKRERIQKKLEAMGPAPEKKPQKKESPVEQPLKPTQIQQRERVEPSDKPQPPTGPQHGGGNAENRVPQGARVPPNNRPGAQGEATMSPATAPRRLSHGQEPRQTQTWTGAGPAPGPGPAARPPGFNSWNSGSQPPRNVWGAPNNDRGLGNGTFNPSLSQMLQDSTVAPPQAGKGPAPIAPPSMSREPSQGQQPQPPAPIGSRPTRYQPGPNLTSKWVNQVAQNDRQVNAERLAEKVERERQLAERGIKPEDAQPVIKETWRQVQVNDEGNRQSMAPKESRVGPPAHPGVIGSGAKPGQAPPPQGPKTSRFFPSKDVRNEFYSRPGSPTPPPPTMEGHPVYEGDVSHPNVNFPRPHPVVKLPPAAMAAQEETRAPRQSFAWASPTPYKDAAQAAPPTAPRGRTGGSQSAWQQRFNKLLNTDAAHRSAAIDASSKSALDYSYADDLATVSLPGASRSASASGLTTTRSKPMAEECFDEPEMGSLPLVKVPRAAPDALWQPAEPVSMKPLHKRLQVYATATEPIYFPAEVANGNQTIRIFVPGMPAQRSVSMPFTSNTRGRGKRGRGGTRGKDRRENSTTGHEPAEPTISPGPAPSERGGRGRGRGRGYRGRGSDWSRGQSALQT